jgi:hypothetical protein
MSHVEFRIRFGAIAMLASFALHFLFPPLVAVAANVDVPVGTVVFVVFNDVVDPAAASPGQTIMLSVVNRVVIAGTTVIEAGAPVLGEVTVAEKTGSIGKPAKIGIMLRYVEAVDGTNIPLVGQKLVEGESKQTSALVVTILCCVLGLLMKGGTATIAAGSQVQATTMAPVTVVVPD